MKVYLASSMKNHLLNSQIDAALRNAGIDVFLPQRDTSISGSSQFRVERKAFAEAVYRSNVRGIDESDLVIVVAQGIGIDTSWECGYAIGRQKKVILLLQENDSVMNMYMLLGALSQSMHKVSFSNGEDFEASIKSLVNRILEAN